MIKVGIYADSIARKKIQITIIQYFKEINVEAEINYLRTSNQALDIIDLKNKYNIIIISENNELIYIKRNSVNYAKGIVQLTSGLLGSQLSREKLDELLFSGNEYNCPHGIYKINSNKTLRLVPHEDIEYFHWSKGKSIIYLKNNETEEILQSTRNIKKELSEDYFVDCARGYIVNLFNVRKIDKINQEIILTSGNKIPISRKRFQNTFGMFIKAIYGIEL